MKMQKISTRGMSREEWLKERKKSLGGSDMGAVLGLNKYRSPYTVWAEKTGSIVALGEVPALVAVHHIIAETGEDRQDRRRARERGNAAGARFRAVRREPL